MAKTRSIFEEVGAQTPAEPVAAPRRRPPARRAIAIWLSVLFVLVVAMIAAGGMTRLTDSGLSITEWRPVTGALPPLSAADWEAEFALYRDSPQYRNLNAGMELAEFKRIYWWEWGHRQLGRLTGAVWGLGFLWFLLRRRIPVGWTPRLLALGTLGALQGAVGWWMVASGLEGERVSVASTRLAVHLGLAFLILGLITWFVLGLSRQEGELLQARRQRSPGLMRWGTVLAALGFAQILLGALVAGIDAGRTYIDWPLMGGEVFPSAALDLSPVWANFVENPGLVQFNHRLAGYLLFILGVAAWVRSRRSAMGHLRRAFDAAMIAVAAQVALGIVTVLYGAPWQVAILHQLGAVALFALLIRARFAAQFPKAQRIARA